MSELDYKTLIYLDEYGEICECDSGERVFVLELLKSEFFAHKQNGYPIKREALEYCLAWDVESIHLYGVEEDETKLHVFDLGDYINGKEAPVFDDVFLISELSNSV